MKLEALYCFGEDYSILESRLSRPRGLEGGKIDKGMKQFFTVNVGKREYILYFAMSVCEIRCNMFMYGGTSGHAIGVSCS